MKKILLIIALACTLTTAFAQDIVRPNPVYVDFSDKTVSAASLDWSDNTAVTKFLKDNVPGIPEGYFFTNYRTNHDVMGYSHYDCKQMVTATGVAELGRELIIHTDASGKVIYITGDLWKEGPTASSPAKAKGVLSDDGRTIYSIHRNGKGYNCYKQIKGFECQYIDEETGEVVLSESLLHFAEKATEAQKAMLKGNCFFQDSAYMVHPELTGAKVGDKYVLQDPDRKIYTVDYSKHIVDKKAGHMVSEDEIGSNLYSGTVDKIIGLGKDFESSSSDFSIEHGKLSGRLSRLIVTSADGTGIKDASGQTPTGEFTYEIRKCPKEVVLSEGNEAAWTKGKTLTTTTAMLQNDTLCFDLSDVTFSEENYQKSTPQQLSEYNDTMYISCITYAGKPVCRYSFTRGPLRYLDDVMTDTLFTASEQCQFYMERKLEQCQPAIDVHWVLERCMDSFKEWYGFNSFDNQGTPLVALVNITFGAGGMPSNSAALATGNPNAGTMIFGLGTMGALYNNRGMYPCVPVDFMAHEFTHLVASKLSNPCDADALNESYADILGKKVERYSVKDFSYMSGDKKIGSNSWEFGQKFDAGTPQTGDRDFSNPKLTQKPEYYEGKYWDNVDYESHNNSTVQSHWFYLLCTGGDVTPEKGETVNITAVDRDSAEMVVFSSLVYFGVRNLTYAMARKNSICAAKMYYGENSPIVESIYKAWYACGVGTDEWKPGDPTGIDAVYSNSSLNNPASPRKVFKNGCVIIQKNNQEYNVIGQKL